jgi:excisionase family DNA binding protein
MHEIMTPKEVARYLQISLLTVYKYAKQGTIPGFRIGNSWRFHKENIDQAQISLGRGLKKSPEPAAGVLP